MFIVTRLKNKIASEENKAAVTNFFKNAAHEIFSNQTVSIGFGVGIYVAACIATGYHPASVALPFGAGMVMGNIYSRMWRHYGGLDIIPQAKSTADSVIKYCKYAAKEVVSIKTLGSIISGGGFGFLVAMATNDAHLAGTLTAGFIAFDVVGRALGQNRDSDPIEPSHEYHFGPSYEHNHEWPHEHHFEASHEHYSSSHGYYPRRFAVKTCLDRL